MAKHVVLNSKVKKIVRRGAPGPASTDADPTFDSLTLDPLAAAPVSPAQGQAWFDQDELTWTIRQNGTDLQVGQETQYNVKNNSGSTITDGTPVMATGSIGASGRITVSPMDGTTPTNAKLLLGIATEEILNGADGKVSNFGKIRGIDASGTPQGETWSAGDLLWISDTTAGELTNIEPVRGGLGMPVAFVVTAHASVGTIFIRITSLDEHLLVTPDQRDGLDEANNPSATNAVATEISPPVTRGASFNSSVIARSSEVQSCTAVVTVTLETYTARDLGFQFAVMATGGDVTFAGTFVGEGGNTVLADGSIAYVIRDATSWRVFGVSA